MINPTSRNVNIISLIISIIIFATINGVWLSHNKVNLKVSFNSPQIEQNIVVGESTEEAENKNEEIAEEKASSNWQIEIPKIDLVAEIQEGTTQEVMNKYVGHFEETKLEYGNVGLAAHNRGYPVNYFENLKQLKEGDEITYKHGDFEMTYVVEVMEIIENTNWDYLENTEENTITLITCVENEPKYRRCIQGVEKIESEEF